jgi:hypothetical protein
LNCFGAKLPTTLFGGTPDAAVSGFEPILRIIKTALSPDSKSVTVTSEIREILGQSGSALIEEVDYEDQTDTATIPDIMSRIGELSVGLRTSTVESSGKKDLHKTERKQAMTLFRFLMTQTQNEPVCCVF